MPPPGGRRASIDISYQFGERHGVTRSGDQPFGTGTPADQQRYGWGQTPSLYGGMDLRPRFEQQFQPDAGVFSPSFPLVPVEPELARLWDYQVGYNYLYTPRSYEPVGFAELRQLAASENLTRMAIETRKDQLEKLEWQIKPRDEKNAAKGAEPRIKKLTEFWRKPDGDRPFATWLRELLEDVLVIDAPTLEVLKNRDGTVRGYDIVDGSTIKVLIDITGRRPAAPAPAFEQVIHGRPWRLFTEDELVYVPRNKRPGHVYGYCYDSETEILTKRGFVLFRDLTTGDVVATRNQTTKRFEWQRPTHIIDELYSGPMYRLHSRSLDLLVTPQHRVLLDSMPRAANGGKKHTGRGVRPGEVLVEAEVLAVGGYNHMNKIPMTSGWVGVGVQTKKFAMAARVAKPVRWVNQFGSGTAVRTDSAERAERPITISGDDYCALMGAYLAEGNIRSAGGIEIAQHATSKGYKTYGQLVARVLGGPAQHNGRAFVLPRRGLTEHFAQFGPAHDKFIPDEIREATPHQLKLFWDHFVLGDGSFEYWPNKSGRGRAGEPGTRITTVSRKLADGLVEVAQKLGWHAFVRHDRSAGTQMIVGNLCNVRDRYIINVRYSKAIGFKMAKVQYDGSIHCVTVPNGVVYVRRHGKPAWSSNSPVEQILLFINIALRRQMQQLYWFSEGNIPPGFLGIPELNAEQVAKLQQHIDSVLAGNLPERSKMQLFPYGAKWTGIKPPPLKDDFDEWLARVVMFCFSLPPDAFIRQRARAAAETARQSALEEGLAPLMGWVKRLIDWEIQVRLKSPDLEFAWQDIKEVDPDTQSKVETTYVKLGIKTIDEARDVMGLDPLPGGVGAKSFVVAGNQVLMVSDIEESSAQAVAPKPPPVLPGAFGAPRSGAAPPNGRGGAATPGAAPHGAQSRDPAARNNGVGRGGAGSGRQASSRNAAGNEPTAGAKKVGELDATTTSQTSAWPRPGVDEGRRGALDREARWLLRRHRAARVEADLRAFGA